MQRKLQCSHANVKMYVFCLCVRRVKGQISDVILRAKHQPANKGDLFFPDGL